MKKKDIQLIEDYIDGRLTGEELISFELMLTTDDSFAEAYRERKKLAQLWNEAREYQGTKKIVEDALRKTKQGFFIAYRYHLLTVAASVTIILGGYFLLRNEGGDSQNGLNEPLSNMESQTNDTNTIHFKVDEPNHLAAIDTVKATARLIHPVAGEFYGRNEPITFRWATDHDQVDTLFIRSDSESAVLSKTLVKLLDTAYTMKYPQLRKGQYNWNLASIDQIGKFSITDEK